jgi:hypothetical protein
MVRVEFSDETRKRDRVGEGKFETVWRDHAMVKMKPAGGLYPLYQNRDCQAVGGSALLRRH